MEKLNQHILAMRTFEAFLKELHKGAVKLGRGDISSLLAGIIAVYEDQIMELYFISKGMEEVDGGEVNLN